MYTRFIQALIGFVSSGCYSVVYAYIGCHRFCIGFDRFYTGVDRFYIDLV